LRRQAQLKAMRPDLEIHPLRGNVDTRIRKMEEGQYDAIILASAGLNRLGLTRWIREVIPAEVMCPAAGQGALGIEIRKGDKETLKHLEFLNDVPTRLSVLAERALLNELGGGCQVPIGAHAQVSGNAIELMGVVARPDGTLVLRDSRSGNDPVKLGEELGKSLLERGGREILKEVYGENAAVPAQP
jgi:hydroxymethylbilane synthase